MRLHGSREERDRVRYFMVSAATATAIGALALGAGAVAGGMALAGGNKGPEAPMQAPQGPTAEGADNAAKAETLRRRKIIERTGGKTILSSDYGTTGSKTLLGE